MSDTWVMTDEDKIEKKKAAEIKKKIKTQAANQGHKNVDLSCVPLSSYLRKRADFKQTLKRRKSSNSTAAPSTSAFISGDEKSDSGECVRSRNDSGEFDSYHACLLVASILRVD